MKIICRPTWAQYHQHYLGNAVYHAWMLEWHVGAVIVFLSPYARRPVPRYLLCGAPEPPSDVFRCGGESPQCNSGQFMTQRKYNRYTRPRQPCEMFYRSFPFITGIRPCSPKTGDNLVRVGVKHITCYWRRKLT